MNDEVKQIIKTEAKRSQARMLLTAVLAFMGCSLTAIFYPSKLFDVVVLFLIGVCFNFGVTSGILLLAKKISRDK